jgi:phage head maturation protease
MLSGGALACVLTDGGQTRAVVNHKVATVLGISPSQGGSTPLTYVGK